MKNTRLKQSLILTITVMLMGCLENQRDTDQLCAETPELRCDELNIDDGQCRVTRTNLIWHRQDALRDPNDLNKIKEFQLTQQYRTCLEVAAQIQPLDKDLTKQRRFDALVAAGNNLEKLIQELNQFHTPESLYFLWSQNNDRNALREFLQMENSPELETARLQYALATFYVDIDAEKTLVLLNNALELSDDPKQLNVEILQSLASINQLLKRTEHSYIWAIVAKAYGVPIVEQKWLDLLYNFDQDKREQLDELADLIISAIRKGQYRRNIIPDYLN
jgi:hypothetical protein